VNDAHIAVLGIGAVALVLQLFVIARCRRTNPPRRRHGYETPHILMNIE
jgi:hypothetical protein